MENTKIAWATHSWSPWIGCSPVHAGCQACYAEAMAKRMGVVWGPNGTRRRTAPSNWKKPLTWQRAAKRYGKRPRVFPSMCDVFENWAGPITDKDGCEIWNFANYENPRLLTMEDVRSDWFRLVDMTPDLWWLALTKRPENVQKMLVSRDPNRPLWLKRENLCFGYSASDEKTLEELPVLWRVSTLTPFLFLSLEPLIGPVDLSSLGLCKRTGPCVGWVIVGGESGPRARPCNVEWIRSIVEDCGRTGIPCFVKQDSGPKPGMQGRIPDDLWAVKQYPEIFKS